MKYLNNVVEEQIQYFKRALKRCESEEYLKHIQQQFERFKLYVKKEVEDCLIDGCMLYKPMINRIIIKMWYIGFEIYRHNEF